MATIGQQLTSPESGWKRYDDADSRIKYTGFTRSTVTAGQYYNNTSQASNLSDSKIEFKFYGTKIRIIDALYTDRPSSILITIDGVIESYSTYKATVLTQALVYEKVGLPPTLHTIVITRALNDTKYFGLDAIDIDDTGYLMHPVLNEVHYINDIKNIGDCISCRYNSITSGQVGFFSELGTTIAPEIPVTSSATPDGSFYWVYAGKDYLGRKKFIADRNIQHSIAWDTLNNAGICSESPLFNVVKVTNISASSTYDVWTASKAIDGGNSNLQSWQALSATNEWIKVEIPSNKAIGGILYRPYNEVSYALKNFKIQGSNDDTNWVDILVSTATMVDSQYFDFGKSVSYEYLRLYCISNGGAVRVVVGDIQFIEYSPSTRLSIRLLTGGTSATDTDNEWDKIIVNSTLGNKIIPGDNNIWNWKGVDSWTSTTLTGKNTNRIDRGSTASNGYDITGISSVCNAGTAFRPVLLVEILITNKFLIEKDSKYYSIKPEYYDEVSHSFIPLTLKGIDKPNKEDIDTFGFDNLNHLLSSIAKGGDIFKPIDKLDNNFDIKLYTVS